MRDRITLRGLRARGHHGVFDFERREGQDFVVDAVLYLDTAPAAASDDVEDTVHYGLLADRLVAIVTGDPVDLIETLAERLAAECMSSSPSAMTSAARTASRSTYRHLPFPEADQLSCAPTPISSANRGAVRNSLTSRIRAGPSPGATWATTIRT